MLNYSGIRVLIVDDEQFIRESLVEFFRDYCFDVSWADSALSGLKKTCMTLLLLIYGFLE